MALASGQAYGEQWNGEPWQDYGEDVQAVRAVLAELGVAVAEMDGFGVNCCEANMIIALMRSSSVGSRLNQDSWYTCRNYVSAASYDHPMFRAGQNRGRAVAYRCRSAAEAT